jgi:DNA-binding GntR family transcriptional regulator
VRIRDERISHGPDGPSDLTEPPRKERAAQPCLAPPHTQLLLAATLQVVGGQHKAGDDTRVKAVRPALDGAGGPAYLRAIHFGIPNSMLQALPATKSLIDRAYQQMLESIADGTLIPGQRIRQAELADTFGISRQPVSHALHLLKRQGLVEAFGRKGLRVVPLDPFRVMQLYQVREVVDGLAARLAAQQIAAGSADRGEIDSLEHQLAAGSVFDAFTPIPVLVRADTDFHRGLYRLSGNTAIEEMTTPLWPHLMRSMAMVLGEPDYATRVWRQEHAAILRHILAGDPARAEAAARAHAATAARLTAEQLQPKAA